MTFEEWFKEWDKKEVVDGYDSLLDGTYHDGGLNPVEVKDFMKEAWDARYSSLTYNDI